MRRAKRALTGLAAACALAACGLEGGRQASPGTAPAPTAKMDAKARFGLLTNGTTCPTTGCPRFVGAATGTVEVRGVQATFNLRFDVIESGDGDVGEVFFERVGDTPYVSTTPPVVSFDGTDVVVAAALVAPGPIPGLANITLRFDRTNPTTVTITSGGDPIALPVTSFQTTNGSCGPCQAYIGNGRYGDPLRAYTFNVVDKGGTQAPDDFGSLIIDVAGDTYLGTTPTVTNVAGFVTIAANAIRASDNADVAVRIEYFVATPLTASIYLDDLLIDPNATQTANTASSCDLFPSD